MTALLVQQQQQIYLLACYIYTWLIYANFLSREIICVDFNLFYFVWRWPDYGHVQSIFVINSAWYNTDLFTPLVMVPKRSVAATSDHFVTTADG